MVGEEKCSFVVKHLGDSDQSAVSSENLYFSIGFNQLSERNFPITSVTLITFAEIYHELG